MKLPNALQYKLEQREEENALRQLTLPANGVDWVSNDYLGYARNEALFHKTHAYLVAHEQLSNGATGSRLLSGNHPLYPATEAAIAHFHHSEAALLFNSGYDANVGFFSSVPQRLDVILYDELCHASIRDGIQMSKAKSYKYSHNDTAELEQQLKRYQVDQIEMYVVTESVFSMDGDTPNIEQLVHLTQKYNAHLVVDEAHALGVFGNKGEGLVQSLGFEQSVFARIMTFGKGLGCHGAAVLGSRDLYAYLVNFARSFIYTTGLAPHSVASILIAYEELAQEQLAFQRLQANILFFNQEKLRLGLKPLFVYSKSAIQSAIIPGNETVKNIATQLQHDGYEVKAILSPTVPAGQERLRFCLHSYNTQIEIQHVLERLATLVF